ncbi:MAG: hypothetical protein P8076_09625 [Gammaproteobacteria bacterium]
MELILKVDPSFEPSLTIRVRLPDSAEEIGKLYAEGGNHSFTDVDVPRITRVLESGEIARIRRLVDQAKVSLAPPLADGLDGTTVTLEIDHGMNAATYTWWNEAPEGWEPVRELAQELATLAGMEERLGW